MKATNHTFTVGRRKHRLWQRGRTLYVRFMHKGTPVCLSLGPLDVPAAKLKAAQIIQAKYDGAEEKISRTKQRSPFPWLAAIAERYVQTYGVDQRRRRTARGNVGCLEKIVRVGAGLELTEARASILTAALVRLFETAELKRVERDGRGNMLPASEVRVRTSLASVVRQARSIFSPRCANYFDDFTMPDLTGFRNQPVTAAARPFPLPLDHGVWNAIEADVARLRSEDPPVYATFLLFSQCGLRNGEIKAARRSWIRRKPNGSGEIDIRERPEEGFKPKTKTSGAVPIARPVLEELWRISEADPEGYLVPARTATERAAIVDKRHSAWIGRFIKGRTKTSYELRRHAGSMYYEQTKSLRAVQKFLRHADLQTTMRWYLYLTETLEPLSAPNFLQPPPIALVA